MDGTCEAEQGQPDVSAVEMKRALAMAAKWQQLEHACMVDMQNARAMRGAALPQQDMFAKRFVFYFAAAWSIFSMVYFLAVTFAPPPAAGLRIADTILGVLIASVVGVMFGYFYGGTKGAAGSPSRES